MPPQHRAWTRWPGSVPLAVAGSAQRRRRGWSLAASRQSPRPW
eukprot:CAMPEP_0175608168 /NCGR_PEP_ID=MMETSP0096-20121207/61604_1 /TAXON_ID=311494 /ORGANISM="Alexandrium monilatum, Strain CCMP3105" /LENGTH=42 /DNA_ID= /DNA_START= /DNA_END= /DNA_ORIENTATION=